MMQTLKNCISSIYISDSCTPSKTLESYAANLKLLLEPLIQTLLNFEKRLINPKDFEINTVISLLDYCRETFEQLQRIYNLHEKVFLNLNQHPPHIYSAYLLSSLVNCHRDSSNAAESNLAISLFLSSLEIFCNIIDTWWTEGRLDDWLHEFIVERLCFKYKFMHFINYKYFNYRVNSTTHAITVRPYYKDKEKSFFVSNHISKIISNNSIFCLLLEHSLEAGCTLNLLYEINRIGDLSNACEAIEGKLYQVFIKDVLSFIEKMQGTSATDDELDSKPQIEQQPKPSTSQTQVLNQLSTKDEFLLLAFSLNMESESKDECDTFASNNEGTNTNALYIYKQLQKSNSILPLEEGILNALSRILKKRIAFANSFVMQLYKEEFDVLRHLQNIRKVLLLEASDLMHQFYAKLFSQVSFFLAKL